MKSYKQALMTVFVVFATAYILTLLGCAKSNDVSGPAPAPTPQPGQPQTGDVSPANELQPMNLEYLRECTKDEFSTLVDWSNDLAAANDAIRASTGSKSENVVKLSLKAIAKCDAVQFYHSQKPCKKTTRAVTDPDHPAVRAYDAYRIHQRCDAVDGYLKKFDLRPDPKQVPLPVTIDPVQPGQISQCSSEEFTKLNTWRAALDQANKNLARFGQPSSWKFDTAALDATKTATVQCEYLISYHQARPCMREKTYTAQSLLEQCATSRTYYYNYAQRTESLIVPNARLVLNTAIFAGRNEGFKPGPSNLSHGQCVITNTNASTIVYKGQKVLVTEARVYTDPQYQMFVLQTQEGLKLECYGVEYSSAATSLTEVIRLLGAKETLLLLSYELN